MSATHIKRSITPVRTVIWKGADVRSDDAVSRATSYSLSASSTTTPFCHYGAPHASYAPMAIALTNALAQRDSTAWPSRSHARLRFFASPEGVSVDFPGYERPISVPLARYAPYMPHMDADRLLALIDHSLRAECFGTAPIGLSDADAFFLRDRAIPHLLDAKNAGALVGSQVLTCGLKCFGLGDYGLECLDTMRLILRHLATMPLHSEIGVIRLIVTAFDIDRAVLSRGGEYVMRELQKTAAGHPLHNRLLVEGEFFYGDLLHPPTVSVMQRYGSHDIVLWRNTHVLHKRDRAYGESIVAGLRSALARPGALVVHEGLQSGRFDMQELLTQ